MNISHVFRTRAVQVSATPPDPFRPVLLSPDPQQDCELAELIEQDGRDRLDRNLPCALDRYYGAVPDLLAKPMALDAAIDISLRSLAQSDGSFAPDQKHAEVLLRSYPELAGPIRLAALLHNQTLSTSGPSPIPHRRRSYPCRIGAPLENGKPRYELLRPLGRGRSGIVCEAIDHLLSDAGHAAKVAVKLIPVDPTTAQRQTAEATKARRVEHPGVVRVLDRGLTDSEELYLVYELVPGGDLEAWFHDRGRRIAPEEGASIVAGIAAGVQAAHSAGLVHCDLKPQNVLMDPTGRPRVSDFGVSAMTEAFPGMDHDGAGVPMGNLAFAAPEQIRRSTMYASPLVDVYALGGILYYLLSGAMPNGNTSEEVARNHHPTDGRQAAPSVSAANPDCDARLDRICARAMAPRPEHRYSNGGGAGGRPDGVAGAAPDRVDARVLGAARGAVDPAQPGRGGHGRCGESGRDPRRGGHRVLRPERSHGAGRQGGDQSDDGRDAGRGYSRIQQDLRVRGGEADDRRGAGHRDVPRVREGASQPVRADGAKLGAAPAEPGESRRRSRAANPERNRRSTEPVTGDSAMIRPRVVPRQ